MKKFKLMLIPFICILPTHLLAQMYYEVDIEKAIVQLKYEKRAIVEETMQLTEKESLAF